MSAVERSFERQVVTFLGGMAGELPSGRSVPPRPMLRRARAHMTVGAVVCAAFVVLTILLGTLATHALLTGNGSLPAPSLIGGAGGTGEDPNGAASAGTGPAVLVPGALGPLTGAFDGYEGSYDRSVRGRGPDGGAWGGPVSKGSTGPVDGTRPQPPAHEGNSNSGGSGSDGRVVKPPPPIWIWGTTGGVPPPPAPGMQAPDNIGGGRTGDRTLHFDG